MKRQSERQLTKDDIEADSGDDNTQGSLDQTGFQRAAPEVIAKRRILKVRRTMPDPVENFGMDANRNGVVVKKQDESSEKEKTEKSAAQPNPFAVLSEAAPKEKEGDALKVAEETRTLTVNATNDVKLHEKRSRSMRDDRELRNMNASTECLDGPGDAPCGNGGELGKEKEKENDVAANARKRARLSEDGQDLGEGTWSKNSGAEDTESIAVVLKVGDGGLRSCAKVDESAEKGSGISGIDEEVNGSKGIEESTEVLKRTKSTEDGRVEGTEGLVPKDELKPGEEKYEVRTKNSGGLSFGGLAGGTAGLTFASAAKGCTKTLSFGVADTVKAERHVDSDEGVKHAFKEEKVETGEENEDELFRARVKLYSLEQGEINARWKERGVGALKLKDKSGSGRGRLLMRTEATLRVVLNTPLYDKFEVDKASERSLRFQGFEVDDEGEKRSTCFLVRFSTKDMVNAFISAIEKWKGSNGREEE